MFKNVSPDLVRSGRTCPENLGVWSCPVRKLICPVRLSPNRNTITVSHFFVKRMNKETTLEIQLSSLQPKLKGLLFFMPHGQTGQDVCRKFRMFHNGPKIWILFKNFYFWNFSIRSGNVFSLKFLYSRQLTSWKKHTTL